MPRYPYASQGMLFPATDTAPIVLDTPAWSDWLDAHTSFAYQSLSLRFTVRREERPGGLYWYAYKRAGGKLRKRYLGCSADLTEARLRQMAHTFVHAEQDDSRIAAPALVTTRFAIPHPSADVVHRPQLTARLLQALEHPCTLLIAPAGSGKTTLISLCSEQLSTWRVAWLSLETSERDHIRFWLYLLNALERAIPGSTRQASQALQEQFQQVDNETLLIPLINTLTELHSPLLLILDDYHLAETDISNAALHFLIEHMPPTLRLAILTRNEPALPLARWHVQKLVTEFRQQDLSFSETESALFLKQTMGLQLDPEQITTLTMRTEGWIAGLQLAALSLRGQSNPAAFITRFAGDNRYIGDYLMSEVINRQPPQIQDFLLHTAPLPRICGALCNAITGRDDGQEMLAMIERATIFIVALDQQHEWYRYHHLFSEMLHKRLTQEKPDQLRTCYARAAQWFAEHGEIHQAIELALLGQAFPLAARLITDKAEEVLQHGEVTTLQSWLQALPASLLTQHQHLALFSTAVLLMQGKLDQATVMLQQLETNASFPEDDAALRGKLAAVQAFHALLTHNDMSATRTLAQAALRDLAAEHGFLHDLASLLNASMTLLLAPGKLDTLTELLTETAQSSIRRGNSTIASFALDNRSLKELSQGRLHQVERTCQEALHLPAIPQLQDAPFTSWAYLRLGDIYREWNQLIRAREILEQGLAQSTDLRYPEIAVDGYLALARVYHLLNDPEKAWHTVQLLERSMQQNQVMPYTVWQVEACRARLLYAGDNTAEALRWSARYEEHLHQSTHPTPPDLSSFSDFTLARLQLAQGRYTAAQTLLQRLLTTAQQGGRGHAIIEASILLALLEQANGQTNEAQHHIVHALHLAAPEGYVRLFLDEGVPMLNLLSHIARTHASTPEQRSAHHYARRLLTQAGQNLTSLETEQPVDLSKREREILHLLASGRSNAAIAEALSITLSTVKWHIAHIYDKLAVNTRAAAIARAHELGLLGAL